MPSSKILTSIFGRRLGLQAVTTSVWGSTNLTNYGGTGDLLAGPDAYVPAVSTNETTGNTIKPWGMSLVTTGAGGSTNTAYTLGKPIPGVQKQIAFLSSNTATNMIAIRASTDASITFESSLGSTMSVIASSQGTRGVITMVGLTSTSWALVGFTTAMGFSLSTST